jgi:L,D-transpeptidase ErfK/SrfK
MKVTPWTKLLSLVGISLALATTPAFAKVYEVPMSGNQLVGKSTTTSSQVGDTLTKIAQRYDLGINEITEANPGMATNAILPPGTHIIIPSTYILPPMARKGIVINLPEMRMYYYIGDGTVRTYPVGIGKVGKIIPIKQTAVARKVENPVWIPPQDIREFNQSQGIILPHVMPAGPDNPLGPYAIYLKIPTFLIHSTIFPESVGRRASFGCIRMHEADIKDFFPLVQRNTPVTIIDMPTKAGWENDQLFVETHAPLEERSNEQGATFQGMVDAIDLASANQTPFVDWQMLSDLVDDRDGKPHNVGFMVN